MVIKDNFNKNSVNPLNDYTGIGKGSHSIEREIELEKQGFIKENMNNKILEELRSNHDDSEDDNGDKWDFFR